MHLHSTALLSTATLLAILLIPTLTMSTNTTNTPVTRIACFKFHPNVTAAQKAGRTSAFLDLYAQHPELTNGAPKGGRPLSTPLDLTNVKRDEEWDTGFIVVFKVRARTVGWRVGGVGLTSTERWSEEGVRCRSGA